MDTVIKNGTIVTASETYKADIGIQGGQVSLIGKDVEGDEVIDADGLYVLPGGVDVHTHMELPVGETKSSDDFVSGTVAAACGGTTTIVDFADQERGLSIHEVLEKRLGRAQGRAVIDFGLHVSITDANASVLEDEMPALVKEGIASFKVYLAYPGRYMVDDGSLFRVLLKTREIGALVLVHAENGQVVDYLIQRHLSEGKTSPLWHARSRPAEAEAEATGRAIALAAMAEAPIYVVHVTCRGSLEKVREARQRGELAFAETCTSYLLCTEENYNLPGFEGAKYTVSPPLRERADQEALWRALGSGDLQVVSTDHCPFNFLGQKELGREDFSLIPSGMPGVETRLPLLYHFGVNEGRFSINRFVELVATNPARLMGLYPQKGSVTVGGDADLVIFDPRKQVRLRRENLHMNVDYSPYEDVTVRGYPVRTISRGKTIVLDGEFVGRQGDGQFLRRKPFVS
ncbi:MAG TPA: dihydropyrimidinase [Anaerolineae bacterium]|nr:dihydropyrimidinase [Anaerolineae bacterium]